LVSALVDASVAVKTPDASCVHWPCECVARAAAGERHAGWGSIVGRVPHRVKVSVAVVVPLAVTDAGLATSVDLALSARPA